MNPRNFFKLLLDTEGRPVPTRIKISLFPELVTQQEFQSITEYDLINYIKKGNAAPLFYDRVYASSTLSLNVIMTLITSSKNVEETLTRLGPGHLSRLSVVNISQLMRELLSSKFGQGKIHPTIIQEEKKKLTASFRTHIFNTLTPVQIKMLIERDGPAAVKYLGGDVIKKLSNDDVYNALSAIILSAKFSSTATEELKKGLKFYGFDVDTIMRSKGNNSSGFQGRTKPKDWFT